MGRNEDLAPTARLRIPERATRRAPARPRTPGARAQRREEQLDRALEPGVAVAEATGHARFVVAAVGSCLTVLAAVLALNVLVDPFAISGSGLLPPAVETDRSTKLNLIQRLSRNPEIVVLGSSRARQAEPAFLERLTGRRGFNAAVTGGTAADAWVMTRYVTDRFPDARRTYIWFADVGIATAGVNPQLLQDPRAKRYFEGKGLHFTLEDVGTYISFAATRASWRVLDTCVIGTCEGKLRYLADGSIAARTMRYLPERARSLRASVERLARVAKSSPSRAGRVDPKRYAYFERALEFMNEHGARPVIVLNPIHPTVLAALRARGFPARRTALAYLRALHRRFDFVLVDCQDIRRWGGSPDDFTNATHVNRRNMRRMLEFVVARSGRALA